MSPPDTGSKRSRRKRKEVAARAQPSKSDRARIRMYRHGLGDCLLVTLRGDKGPFYLLIDCGLLQNAGKPAEEKLRKAVLDVIKTTGGFVDVLVATHEHWDHLSGFVQCRDLFATPAEGRADGKLAVGEVWLPWTEDPADPLAGRLAAERGNALRGLQAAVTALQGLAANASSPGGDRTIADMAEGVDRLLGFFGAAGSRTAGALRAVRDLASGKPRYCRPSDPPWSSQTVPDVRIYTLAPPLSEADIKRTMAKREVYELALEEAAASAFYASAQGLDDSLRRSEDGEDINYPFDKSFGINLNKLREMSTSTVPEDQSTSLVQFFGRYYWGMDQSSAYPDQAWRRIDGDWLGAAQEFALRLDTATNNTSLVLAIEFTSTGEILLFAADAQVGSWLSWQNLSWTVEGKTVTGPDLLRRTVFYKVGHHGSHNATLRDKGLELMRNGELVAFVPVDRATAELNRWHRMPLPGLIDALEQRTSGRVVCSDETFDPATKGTPAHREAAERFAQQLTIDDLYYEYRL